MPFVSIVLPVFNGSAYLDEAIASVMHQEFSDWELIVVDDGSNDGSYELAVGREKKDHRLKVLHHENKKNKGVSASRNLAIHRASGEWIALLDADDVWYPEKLKRQVEIIASNNIVLTYCDSGLIDENGKILKGKKGSGISGMVNNSFRKLIRGFHAPASSVIFNRKIALEINGFNEELSFAEDTLLFHRMLTFGNCYYLNEKLLNFRIHDDSSVSKMSLFFRACGRLRVYESLLSEANPENRRLISFTLINTGYRKIIGKYLFKRSGSVFLILKSILLNDRITPLHKVYAIFVTVIEPLIAAFRKRGQIPR